MAALDAIVLPNQTGTRWISPSFMSPQNGANAAQYAFT